MRLFFTKKYLLLLFVLSVIITGCTSPRVEVTSPHTYYPHQFYSTERATIATGVECLSLGISIVGTNIIVQWDGIGGEIYRLEESNDLNLWFSYPVVTGELNKTWNIDVSCCSGKKFFRLQVSQ